MAINKYITFEDLVNLRNWKPELINIYLCCEVKDVLRPLPRYDYSHVLKVELFLNKNGTPYKKFDK